MNFEINIPNQIEIYFSTVMLISEGLRSVKIDVFVSIQLKASALDTWFFSHLGSFWKHPARMIKLSKEIGFLITGEKPTPGRKLIL